MIIFGIHAPINVGKDTIGDYLRDEHDFEKLAFADPLYNGIAAMLGMSREEAEKTIFSRAQKELPIKPYKQSVRDMCRDIGTGYFRDRVSKQHWISVARARIENIRSKMHLHGIAITDVRHENEADFIRNELGGHIVHVLKKGFAFDQSHESENGIKILPIDYTINNDGELIDLHKQLDGLVATHRFYQKKGYA